MQYGEWTGVITGVSFSDNYLFAHLLGTGELPHGILDVQVETLNVPEYAILVQMTPEQIGTEMIIRAFAYK